MVFHAPIFLSLLLLFPLWWYLAGRSTRVAALTISSTALLGSRSKESTVQPSKRSRFFLSLIFLLLILGMARPQAKTSFTETRSTGVDIFIALDLSASMTALDLSKPPQFVTRLDVAKEVTQDFVKLRQSDRLGMIAFEGEAFLLSPLTLNHLWLEESIGKTKVNRLQGGTAIGTAIAMSIARLKELEAETRILILVTDGENNAGKISPEAAVDLAKTFGVKIYTIGVGSGQRARLPIVDEDGNLQYTRFREPLMSNTAVEPVDEESLRMIADQTGGKYFGVKDRESFEEVFATIDELEKTEVTLREQAIYEEKFYYPVGLAFLLYGGFLIYRFRKEPAYP